MRQPVGLLSVLATAACILLAGVAVVGAHGTDAGTEEAAAAAAMQMRGGDAAAEQGLKLEDGVVAAAASRRIVAQDAVTIHHRGRLHLSRNKA